MRASRVGRRYLQIKGGSSQPVYFVQQSYSDGEDLDRGVLGAPADLVVELKPRPTYVPVTGAQITRQSSILRLGDYQLEVAGSQVTESQFRDASARIVIGNEVFTIINVDPKFVDREVAYFKVFIRGLVNN